MKKKGIRKTIEGMSASLKGLTASQLSWIEKRHAEVIEGEIAEKKNKRKFTHTMLFSHYQYVGDWQIDRVFQSKMVAKNRCTTIEQIECVEISQWFHNVRTHKTYHMQRPLGMFGYIYTNSPLVFRSHFHAYSNAEYLSGCYGERIPNGRLNPIVRRCGYSFDRFEPKDYKEYKWNVRRAIENITSVPFYETLMKSDYWRYVCFRFNENQRKAFLVCMRHHIEIKDINIWRDTIDLMDELGMDWHNPTLLSDYMLQHERALAKKEKIKKQKELDNIVSYEEDYYNTHRDFLDISFGRDNLSFHVLQSVREFFEEGERMHHCVYACGYYKKDDVLIFSVRGKDNRRLATIEFNLKSRNIAQCRGVCNSKPDEYDSIVSVFNENIKYFLEGKGLHTKSA